MVRRNNALLILVAVVLIFSGKSVYAYDIPTTLIISICGDGIVNPGEVCDAGPGANLGGYGSSTSQRTCEAGCRSFGPYCGDGIMQARFGEECDDGNNINGDLCDAQCKSELSVTSGGGGAPTVGGTPAISGAPQGTISSTNQTKVVLRGKGYPNREVRILKDGKAFGTTNADVNVDFLYSTADVTPGTATFGFISKDVNGVDSIITTAVFEIVQGAVTTVANVFIPPTISIDKPQSKPGELITFSGQSIPSTTITTDINGATKTTLNATTDSGGKWALQVDTASLQKGNHTAKSFFKVSDAIKSGYGKTVAFLVGEGKLPSSTGPDLNHDGKVNLIDFSIFLTGWGTDDAEKDFNGDGTVNLADFSIMLFNWTG